VWFHCFAFHICWCFRKVWGESVKLQGVYLGYERIGLSTRLYEGIFTSRKGRELKNRYMRVVNVSLLAKWRWKLLSQKTEFWKEFTVEKYVSHIVGNLNLEDGVLSAITLLRWNICAMENNSNWFQTQLQRNCQCYVLMETRNCRGRLSLLNCDIICFKRLTLREKLCSSIMCSLTSSIEH
jgi:hypothetical protein